MTTETNAQDEAKRLWDQFDAEDNAGQPAAADQSDVVEDADPIPAGTAKAAPGQKEEQTPAPDEDDPKVLRNKLAGLEAIISQMNGRLRNAEGHIGGLNSQVKQQLDAAKTVAAAGASAPSAKEIRAAQDSPQAMAELEREYPEFAKALMPALDAHLNSRMAELETRLPKQSEPATPGLTKADLDAALAEQRIEFKHAGWKKTVATAEFTGWMQTVPREVRLLAGSDDEADAVRLLDLYTEAKGTAPSPATLQKMQRQASAAALPTGQRAAARTKNVDDMTPQEFWAYQDQLDKQKA